MPIIPRRSVAVVALATLLAALPVTSARAAVDKQPFGTLSDGRAVDRYTLTNAKGMTVTVISYGALLTRVQVPDRAGHVGDVLLGYDDLKDYEKNNSPHFGGLIGRMANRIAKGTFTVDGTTYHVPINNGPNSLHGGNIGYDKRLWAAEPVTGGDGSAVKLSLTDPDGEQGYPGTVHVAVTYTLTDAGVLRINYEATTDKATPINLTSHGYWNLKDGGKTDVKDEVMRWHADRYLPVNAVQIPTGALATVAGTPFDFRTPKPIGRDLAATGGDPAGYDHTMVIDGPAGTLRPAVEAYDPNTGRTLSVSTTEPGVQFYTGNSLDGTLKGHDDATYGQYHAFALEAQDFPDAVNQPTFPNCILRPGQTYRQTTEYRIGTGDGLPE